MSSKSWDSRQGKKLVLFIDRAEILTTSKHGSEETRNPFVIVHISGIKNKQQQRTRVLKHTLQPKWKEVFFFEIPYDSLPDSRKKSVYQQKPVLVFEFMDSAIRDRSIGTSQLPLTDLSEDIMMITAKRIRKDNKGKKGDEQEIVGKCQFHLFYSSMSDIPRSLDPAPVPRGNLQYLYDQSMSQFNPGDIILYSTAGPFASLFRVSYGVQWSHCGIVVSVPNKWTSEPELCVVEFGCNKENFIDIYNERPLHNGPMIFRLAERIHGFHGTEAWLLQLREPLDEQRMLGLAEWALALTNEFYANVTLRIKDDRSAPIPFLPFTFNQSQTAYLELLGINTRNQWVYSDYYSAQLVYNALKYIGIEIKVPGKVVQIRDIMSSGHYAEPFLIRCRPFFSDNPYWPAAPDQQPAKPQTTTGLDGVVTHIPDLLHLLEMSQNQSESTASEPVADGLECLSGSRFHSMHLYDEQDQQKQSTQIKSPHPSNDQQSATGAHNPCLSASSSVDQDQYDEESSSDDGTVPEKTVKEEYDGSDSDPDVKAPLPSVTSDPVLRVNKPPQQKPVEKKEEQEQEINEDDYDMVSEDDYDDSDVEFADIGGKEVEEKKSEKESVGGTGSGSESESSSGSDSGSESESGSGSGSGSDSGSSSGTGSGKE